LPNLKQIYKNLLDGKLLFGKLLFGKANNVLTQLIKKMTVTAIDKPSDERFESKEKRQDKRYYLDKCIFLSE
jgi:hypothetical protein